MKTRRVFTWILISAVAVASVSKAGERTQSYPAQKGGTLQVLVAGGAVKVKGWEKEEVFVTVSSLNEEQLKHVTFSQGGGKVLVEFKWEKRNIEDMRFDINVPSTFNVDIRTGGGDLALLSPLSGDLKGSTAGGSITLGTLGGTIRMDTGGGNVSGEDINGDLAVRTAGGDIKFKNLSGSGEISTAGGSVTVESAARSLRVSTAGGNIQVGKGNQEVQLSTAGGNIKVGSIQGKASMNTAGGSISLSSGRGTIQASTSAGSVNLEKVEGSVSARSAAGNVSVALDPSIGESSSLATSAGNIVLKIAESCRATIHMRTRGPAMSDEDEVFFRSDYPLVRSEGSKSRGEGEVILNGGGHTISLETTMGTIEIKKAK